jgi:predicted Zn-dependent protease with MMP-like domain/Tfp pilus assembly protein PilF
VSIEQDLEQGWGKLEEGDVAAARKLGQKAASEEPASGEALLLLAACEREEGNGAEALQMLTRALELDPEWATAELWTAELLAEDPRKLPQALEHATRALDRAEDEDEYLHALSLKAGLEIDLGKPAAAKKTLADLPPPGVAEIPTPLALELADLYLAAGAPAEARAWFQTIADGQPELADGWYGLGLTAEAEGEEEAKRAAWLRALEIDEKTDLEEPLLEEGEMAEVAEEALGELPVRARALIENIPIMIIELPARADVEKGLDPRLLGVFEGTPLPEVPSMGGTPQLTQIVLFRKNLERIAHDVDELREEIRTTLLHETGHFFGMSEKDLADVGLD